MIAWPRSAIASATDEHTKILGALHGRIPMVTPEDIRAVQEESFADDERFWDGMRDLNASHIEGHKAQIALVEAKIAEMEPEVAKAAEKVEVARSKREKLKRGEAVTGGLGKRLDLNPNSSRSVSGSVVSPPPPTAE